MFFLWKFSKRPCILLCPSLVNLWSFCTFCLNWYVGVFFNRQYFGFPDPLFPIHENCDSCCIPYVFIGFMLVPTEFVGVLQCIHAAWMHILNELLHFCFDIVSPSWFKESTVTIQLISFWHNKAEVLPFHYSLYDGLPNTRGDCICATNDSQLMRKKKKFFFFDSLDKCAAMEISATCNFCVKMGGFKNSQIAFAHLLSCFKSTNSRPRICLVSLISKCLWLTLEVIILWKTI